MNRELLLSASVHIGAVIDRFKVRFVSLLFLLFSALAVVLSTVAPEGGEKLFGLFCHQNPERSLDFAGAALPLCARCFGLYSGFGLAGILVPAFSRRFAIRILAAAFTFSILFWFLRFFLPVLDGNLVRLMLGLGLGAGTVLLLKSFLKLKTLSGNHIFRS
jgi:uncharacterized membrane protein